MSNLVIYDEGFADFQLREIPDGDDVSDTFNDAVNKPKPVIETPDEPRHQKQQSPDMETSLLDELSNECKLAKEDYDEYRHPKYTRRIKDNRVKKQEVADFVNRRCENYATNIETIITNLIEHHNFPDYLFEGYTKYASMVRMSVGEPKAVEALYQLYILAHGVIPRDVMYQQPKIISPVLDSTRDTGI